MRKDYITWSELKEALKNLPESQLNEPVRWWGDERGGNIHEVHILEEDMVETEEGWEPKSVQEVSEFQSQEDIEDLPLTAKGYLVLYTA